MKLRCASNSIRIRVRKSEVESLKNGDQITEKVNLGTAVFSFSLGASSTSETEADFADGQLSVRIPQEQMDQWLATEQVGIEVTKQLEKGESLHLLIEKDFPCVTRTTEDKTDTFRELADKNTQKC